MMSQSKVTSSEVSELWVDDDDQSSTEGNSIGQPAPTAPALNIADILRIVPKYQNIPALIKLVNPVINHQESNLKRIFHEFIKDLVDAQYDEVCQQQNKLYINIDSITRLSSAAARAQFKNGASKRTKLNAEGTFKYFKTTLKIQNIKMAALEELIIFLWKKTQEQSYLNEFLQSQLKYQEKAISAVQKAKEQLRSKNFDLRRQLAALSQDNSYNVNRLNDVIGDLESMINSGMSFKSQTDTVQDTIEQLKKAKEHIRLLESILEKKSVEQKIDRQTFKARIQAEKLLLDIQIRRSLRSQYELDKKKVLHPLVCETKALNEQVAQQQKQIENLKKQVQSIKQKASHSLMQLMEFNGDLLEEKKLLRYQMHKLGYELKRREDKLLEYKKIQSTHTNFMSILEPFLRKLAPRSETKNDFQRGVCPELQRDQ